MRKVTYRQIAKEAGVTESTVSRALSDDPAIRNKISEDQRESIRKIATDLGYTSQRSRVQKVRVHTVGVVVTSIADMFWARVVEGAEHVAAAVGWNMVLTFSHNDPYVERRALHNLFIKHQVAGAIVAGSRGTLERFQSLRVENLKLVMINPQYEYPPEQGGITYVSVGVDNEEGARQAVNHLIQLGHKKIGYLGLGIRPKSNRQRKAGYLKALEHAGLKQESMDCWIIEDTRDSHDMEIAVRFGREQAPRLHEAGVTAILCYNDLVAIGASQGLQDAKIAVPGECSVMGFDDIEPLGYVNPRITTMRQPRFELGQIAMLRLLEKLDGENEVIKTMMVNALIQLKSRTDVEFDPENNIFLPTLKEGESTIRRP